MDKSWIWVLALSYGKEYAQAAVSQGCLECCVLGQCDRAFDNKPGSCCDDIHPMSCCPAEYEGKNYHCLFQGNGFRKAWKEEPTFQKYPWRHYCSDTPTTTTTVTTTTTTLPPTPAPTPGPAGGTTYAPSRAKAKSDSTQKALSGILILFLVSVCGYIYCFNHVFARERRVAREQPSLNGGIARHAGFIQTEPLLDAGN
jgi:hypothetical protein